MSFAAPCPLPPHTYKRGRLMLGLLLAPTVPSALMVVLASGEGLQGFLFMSLLGLMAVAIPFTPLMAWRLPRTRHPLLTTILLGALSAPGPFGYTLALVGSLGEGPSLVAAVLLTTTPFGALGGLIFYMCAIWRGPDIDQSQSSDPI